MEKGASLTMRADRGFIMEAVTIREHSVSELLELGKHFKTGNERVSRSSAGEVDRHGGRQDPSEYCPSGKKRNCSSLLETKASYEVMQGP